MSAPVIHCTAADLTEIAELSVEEARYSIDLMYYYICQANESSTLAALDTNGVCQHGSLDLDGPSDPFFSTQLQNAFQSTYLATRLEAIYEYKEALKANTLYNAIALDLAIYTGMRFSNTFCQRSRPVI